MIITILYSIYSYFKTIMFFVLVNDYLKRNYNELYLNLLFSCSYNLIYLYSKGQIFYNKIKNRIKNYIFTNQQIKKFIDKIYKLENIQEIEYINQGKVVTKYNRNDTIINVVKEGTPFYIFSDFNSDLNNIRINKKIIQNTAITLDYEVSNIQFILVEIILGENKYKINLKDEKYNYYLVDNILDKKFFTYFLINYVDECKKLPYDYIYNQDIFVVKIIDNNVNIKEIDLTNNLTYITLKKDDYLY